MPEITLILGGARSGKSAFAESLALRGHNVTYLATADVRDTEMSARIAHHRARRPGEWKTWEGDIASLPIEIPSMRGTLLLDCLTMYLTRLFLAAPESEAEAEGEWFAAERRILAEVERLFCSFQQAPTARPDDRLIVVSNEVGFGLVPPYLMGRRFRDMQGRANQIAAHHARNAALVVAGLPMWLKRSEEDTV